METSNQRPKRSPSERPKPERVGAITQIELTTDRPPEVVRVQRLVENSEVEFWSVSGSDRHWGMVHDTYTSCLVVGPEGETRGRWESRGETRVATPGCVQLMEPDEAHRTVAVSGKATFFVVFWQPEFLERAAAELGIAGYLHFKSAQLEPGPTSSAVAALFRAVNRGDERLSIECELASAARALLSEAADGGVARRAPGGRHPGVRRAVELLRASFRDALSLDELAKEAQLSKFHLARCFREATGFPPHQFQKLLRMREARRLLVTRLSVEEVAERAGFADGPHLTRSFREWIGSPPGAFSRAWAPADARPGFP